MRSDVALEKALLKPRERAWGELVKAASLLALFLCLAFVTRDAFFGRHTIRSGSDVARLHGQRAEVTGSVEDGSVHRWPDETGYSLSVRPRTSSDEQAVPVRWPGSLPDLGNGDVVVRGRVRWGRLFADTIERTN